MFRKWLRRLLARLFGVRSVHYIGGGTLPPPLSAQEEAEAIRRLNAGDAEARSKLIEHNLRLVVYIAKKFDSSPVGMEDLISIGTIGLIKAVNTFHDDKNIKLATYASRCIENEILMVLRRTSRTRGEVSLDEPLNVDRDGNELLLSDVIGTENNVVSRGVDEQAERELLRFVLSKLSARERAIMEMRYGLGTGREKTQKEVADALGISQSYISRLEKKILDRLQREIAKIV
ncbi:MAG: RNA polymerase sporulation sigma factor SigE [Eubacteriales bacterium]|nr:RNA polymerase sporulation sigma factor SigE [Eubacteriales bacterium]